jgi:hypothetical protein
VLSVCFLLFKLSCDICLGWFCVVEADNDLRCFTSPQLAWVFVYVVCLCCLRLICVVCLYFN